MKIVPKFEKRDIYFFSASVILFLFLFVIHPYITEPFFFPRLKFPIETSMVQHRMQDKVNRIKLFHKSKPPPELLERKKNELRREDGLDLNTYFEIFEHLKLHDGYTLVYCNTLQSPFVFSIKQDTLSLLREDDVTTLGQVRNLVSNHRYLHYVETDDTEEGYIELAMLNLLGDSFHLWDHGRHRDTQIICTDEAFYNTLKYRIEKNKHWRKARKVDPTPRVKLDKSSAKVTLLVFNQWGGFFEYIVKFSRKFPHSILSEEYKMLIPYHIGGYSI
jgi:hypothetical protein